MFGKITERKRVQEMENDKGWIHPNGYIFEINEDGVHDDFVDLMVEKGLIEKPKVGDLLFEPLYNAGFIRFTLGCDGGEGYCSMGRKSSTAAIQTLRDVIKYSFLMNDQFTVEIGDDWKTFNCQTHSIGYITSKIVEGIGGKTMKSIREVVEAYFEENCMEDLMGCGASDDEGLTTLSTVVTDCMEELGYKVDYDYTEDSIYGEGKYDVCVCYNGKEFRDEIRAWNGADEIIDFIEEIIKELEKKEEEK